MKLQNEYYILRHGKTEYQKRKTGKIYPGDCTDRVPLAEEGERQIKKRAKELESADLDSIYSSDFLRTRQTAEIVKEEIGFEGEINFDKRLRDVDLGVWHGGDKKEFYENYPKTVERFPVAPEGGESWEDVKGRMTEVLKEIEDKESGTILIISHGDPLWLLEGKVKNKSKEELIKIKKDETRFIKPAELKRIN